MNLGFYQILRLTYTGAESLRHEEKKRIENLSKGTVADLIRIYSLRKNKINQQQEDRLK